MEPPNGYVWGSIGETTFVVRQELETFIREAVGGDGSLYAFAERTAVRSFAGRGATHVIDTATGKLVVRHYHRGGAVASALGDRYARLGTPRPFRELHVSCTAIERGVRTPAAAAAVVYPAGVFYRGDLATEYIPDATTLADLTVGPGRRGDAERSAAWLAAGRLVRDVLDAGLVHPDLNLRNVLVSGPRETPDAWVLDLDRCRLAPRVPPRIAEAMKARFVRSARKFEAAAGATFDSELDAFADGIRG